MTKHDAPVPLDEPEELALVPIVRRAADDALDEELVRRALRVRLLAVGPPTGLAPIPTGERRTQVVCRESFSVGAEQKRTWTERKTRTIVAVPSGRSASQRGL
jgi:hypothetical protein